MVAMISSPCEATREQADACDNDPGLGARNAGLKVFGEAAVASEPGKGALNHPAPRFGFEGSDALRSRDDFDRPLAEIGQRIEQLFTAIDTIGEDVAQFGEQSPDGPQ